VGVVLIGLFSLFLFPLRLTLKFTFHRKIFNVNNDWGKVCIPAHPHDSSVAFALIDKKTDKTLWKANRSMRTMENAIHVPEKRRRLLPGVVEAMITNEENDSFSTIRDGEDFQDKVMKMHLWGSTLGKELTNGPGDGDKMLQIAFDGWLSPPAIQRALREL